MAVIEGVMVTVGVKVAAAVGVVVGVNVLVHTGGNVGTMTACVVGVDVPERCEIAGAITPT